MKKETIDRIVTNAIIYRKDTVIGKYTYRMRPVGSIWRCKTEDIGKTYIDKYGDKRDCWVKVDRDKYERDGDGI